MNRVAFETYIETQLAPCLQPGEVVIADNLSSYKSAVAQAFLTAQGNWLLFLPPYSPDLNPIEMGFSKLKAHLRRMKARTFDTLFEPVADACKLFPQLECRNYFRAAGYVAYLMDSALRWRLVNFLTLAVGNIVLTIEKH